MGRELLPLLTEAGYPIAALIEREGHPLLGRTLTAEAGLPPLTTLAETPRVEGAMVVDFSLPAAMDDLLAFCLKNGYPLLSGTTGLTPDQHIRLQETGETIPLLWAPNFSLGVAVLRRLAGEAARLLGSDYSIHLIETHHAAKKDAPSGTALLLVEALHQAGGEPTVQSMRGGTVPGTHELHFLGPGESLEFTHRAEGRTLFARGAVRALGWLSSQPPGRYRMEDTLIPPDSEGSAKP